MLGVLKVVGTILLDVGSQLRFELLAALVNFAIGVRIDQAGRHRAYLKKMVEFIAVTDVPDVLQDDRPMNRTCRRVELSDIKSLRRGVMRNLCDFVHAEMRTICLVDSMRMTHLIVRVRPLDTIAKVSGPCRSIVLRGLRIHQVGIAGCRNHSRHSKLGRRKCGAGHAIAVAASTIWETTTIPEILRPALEPSHQRSQ